MRKFVSFVIAAGLVAPMLAACGGGGTSITATFDDAGDLQARGSVQVADVRVGQIGKITLTRDFKARVRLNLNPGVRVPRNSDALLRTTSLLGEKFVELRPAGAPDQGPYFANGDVIPPSRSTQAPELEFVADQAVNALGSVVATDVATLVQTGAEAFGGRAPELQALVQELATISTTLAAKTDAITRIIDGLDKTTATLAAGKGDIDSLLVNLADTTRVLADNRERAVNALAQIGRLAGVQNEVLDRYHRDIDRQIKQVDAIVGVVAGQTGELGLLVDWLDKFATALPSVVPGDFTQVFLWVVLGNLDSRVGK